MIKTVLWDFDGVILDSMKIKGNGFVELFQEYPKQQTEQLKEYHYKNGGVSRFDKIRYFYEKILNEEITEKKVKSLSQQFGHIIKQKLFDKEALIQETVTFIQRNYKNYNFHIVSGAEHNELNSLCEYFELSKYFLSIQGSPTKKTTLVENLLAQYNYNVNETILIGDSINDFTAAKDNFIVFYGYNNPELKNKSNYINTFIEFNP